MPQNDDDDLQLHSYQDDLAVGDTPDPFADEEAEDPAEVFGVPEGEFKDELDKETSDEDEDLDADDVDIQDDQRQNSEG